MTDEVCFLIFVADIVENGYGFVYFDVFVDQVGEVHIVVNFFGIGVILVEDYVIEIYVEVV